MEISSAARVIGSAVQVVGRFADLFGKHRLTRRNVAHAREMLGIRLENQYSYRVAMHHPLMVDGDLHPDDAAAFAALAEPDVVHAMARGWLETPPNLLSSLNEGMILVGSPEAEAVTRLAFGYKPAPEGAGMHYEGGVVDLPYRWLEDSRRVETPYIRFVPGEASTVERPNWPIIDGTGPKERRLFPQLRNDGLLECDYLLITKVPNYLTRAAYESGRSLISVAGSHGVGTRSIELLLKDKTILSQIGERLPRTAQGFQLLLQASNIRHRPVVGSIARKIELVDLQLINRSDATWAAAGAAVAKNFEEWERS